MRFDDTPRDGEALRGPAAGGPRRGRPVRTADVVPDPLLHADERARGNAPDRAADVTAGTPVYSRSDGRCFIGSRTTLATAPSPLSCDSPTWTRAPTSSVSRQSGERNRGWRRCRPAAGQPDGDTQVLLRRGHPILSDPRPRLPDHRRRRATVVRSGCGVGLRISSGDPCGVGAGRHDVWGAA